MRNIIERHRNVCMPTPQLFTTTLICISGICILSVGISQSQTSSCFTSISNTDLSSFVGAWHGDVPGERYHRSHGDVAGVLSLIYCFTVCLAQEQTFVCVSLRVYDQETR